MEFQIGAVAYSVRRRWSLLLDGEPVDGYAAWSGHTIMLDADLPDDVLLQTLRHEHAHAWAYEVGEPTDGEGLANFTATACASFDRDFTAQGGLPGLLAVPIEGVRPTKAKAPPPMNYRGMVDRVECGKCGTQIMVGSIYKSAVRTDNSLNILLVDRGFCCPVCDSIQAWSERASESGIPLGEYYDVRLLTGMEADQWLAQHRDVPSPYSQC